jgi:hypothetical protein
MRALSNCIKHVGLSLAAVVAGFSLSSIQLLPYADALFRSYLWHVAIAHGGGLTWPNVFSLIMPNFFGFNGYAFWGQALATNFPETNGGYVGPIAVALAVIAIVNSQKRLQVTFFAAVSLISMLFIYDFPYVSIYSLTGSPLFTITANGRILLLLAFSLAILAGFGADAAKQRGRFNVIVTSLLLALLSLVALSGILLLLAGMWSFSPYSTGLNTTIIVTVVLGFLLFTASILATFGICHSIGQLRVRRKRLLHLLELSLLVLLVLSLFSFGIDANPTQPTAQYPSAPAIQFLHNDSSIYRVLSQGDVFYPETNLEFRLFSIRGYSFSYPNPSGNLEERVGSISILSMFNVQVFNSYDFPALNLMNVKYVMMESGSQLPGPRFKLAYADSSVGIFLNTECLPRAFLVYKYDLVSNESRALDMVADGSFNYTQTVLLGPLQADESPPSVGDGIGNATITSYDINTVGVKTVSSKPGLLFLSEAYYPGWNAYLDGHKVDIYRADYAFRAVAIPSGTHIIEFRYEPQTFYYGALISSATVLFLLGGLLIGLTSRGRRVKLKSHLDL